MRKPIVPLSPPADRQSTQTASGSKALETLRFVANWIRNPLQVGSAIPSSRKLAEAMTASIDPNGGPVLEFGAGTGVFTRQILETGLPASQLEIIEENAAFAFLLSKQFPDVRVHNIDAQHAASHADAPASSYQQVVSGLPLLAMNQKTRIAILDQCFALLRPNGLLVQFTYSTRSPIDHETLNALGLRAKRVARIYRNFPPATVFHYWRPA